MISMSNMQGGKPKYIWLIQQLSELLDLLQANGENCIPSERELCTSYQVSRITVRRALAELEARGKIYRIQGKGAFVNKEKLTPVTQLVGFAEDMQKRRIPSSSRILALEVVLALPRIADSLQVAVNTPVVLLKRLRLNNGLPISIETCYLPEQIGAVVRAHITDNASLYDVLREKCGIIPFSAEQSFSAGDLQPWEQALLGDDAPSYALCCTRKTYEENGRPIEYVETKFRGDGYQYPIHMQAVRMDPPGV